MTNRVIFYERFVFILDLWNVRSNIIYLFFFVLGVYNLFCVDFYIKFIFVLILW